MKEYVECKNGLLLRESIVKHEIELKDLIEAGDILEYRIIKNNLMPTKIGEVKKYKDARSFKEYLGINGFNIENIEILSILTKKQFNERKYVVGG